MAVAKNYLIEREIKDLERIVGMYLDYAENPKFSPSPGDCLQKRWN